MECAEHAPLITNPIIYAEVSIGYTTIEALDAALPTAIYQREALPWEAASLLESAFCCTGAVEARGTRRCRISTLARTLPSGGWRCLRVTPNVIGAIFQSSRFCLPRRRRADDP